MRHAVYWAGAAMVLANSTAVSAHDAYADDHAPIGVMADHAHKKGEVMLSLRVMHMSMQGNQTGTDSIDPHTIVTTVPNRFAGMPMQPPTLRIVPTAMRADMYMLGMMYAPSDAVTLMVMASYVEKEMDHTTYQGGMGTSQLGTFTTNPKALGDTKASALIPLLGFPAAIDDVRNELTVKAGINLPTGSTDEIAQILTPMGDTPTVRVPYMMQAGSGSWDFEPALTYKGRRGKLGFGAQANAVVRLGDNKWGYRLGNIFEASGWLSYRPAQWMSLSGRVRGRTTGRVQGIDGAIIGPVQTANPDLQGGERVDLIGGVNLVATHGSLVGHRLGIEIGAPVYQNLNGPQMTGDWFATVGWQKAF